MKTTGKTFLIFYIFIKIYLLRFKFELFFNHVIYYIYRIIFIASYYIKLYIILAKMDDVKALLTLGAYRRRI